MTHTVRIYNKWAKMIWHPYSSWAHPYRWQCMGNCVCCKDDEKYVYLDRKRKRILLKKRDYERV